MFIAQFLSNPLAAVFFLLSIVIAVTVHEFAHAKTADKLGDPTADLQGRVTLDPRAHLDLMGSILFLLVGFGWGKPVPFDPFNLDNPRRDAAIISFAGPLSNALMAISAAILLRFIPIPLVSAFLEIFIWINIVLGVFNLLPFAPLDGFKIVGGFLPEEQARQWYSMERYGIFLLLFFIFPFAGGRSMLDMFVSPVIGFLVSLLTS